MNVYFEFIRIVEVLNASKVPYAVCGGLAMAVHGYPRATKDIDVLIHPDDLSQVERIVAEGRSTADAIVDVYQAANGDPTRIIPALALT